MKIFFESMKKYRVLWIFSIIMLILAILSVNESKNRQALVYKDELEQVVATVQGQEITLQEFALYVAYQEMQVEAQAKIYNPENPKEYWGLHTNGQFISIATRDAAIGMAIHDELFYQLSQEMDITLSEEELAFLDSDVMDFWYDLTDYGGEEKLGITREDIYNSMYKVACAQKCQLIYTEMKGLEYEDYNFSCEEYLEFLTEYEYSINDKVLERINFGYVTLER